jgi:N-acetylglucosamine kinase-like BadF-type ATPase
MIVIESGGTKSTWAYLDEKSSSVKLIETVGLHPREIDSNKTEIIGEVLKSNRSFQTSSEVYFYGAGCEKQKGKGTIKKLFNSHGFNKISVETDLKGACLALLGNQPGFTGILGTGAVAAQFDGKNIIKQTSGLGHLLGDEGSGFDIGKRLLNAYFNQDLPQNINQEIESFFSNEKDIIHRVYMPDGRMVVASLTHIVKKYSHEKVVKTILDSAFTDYYNTALRKFSKISEINFIGSIAYHFENELTSTLFKHNISVQKVHQTAIKPLFNYHQVHLT